MNSKVKVLTLSLVTLMSSATFAQPYGANSSVTMGGVTIERIDPYESMGRDRDAANTREEANTPSKADRLREMEQDFTIGKKPVKSPVDSNDMPEGMTPEMVQAQNMEGAGAPQINATKDSKDSTVKPSEDKKAPVKPTYRKSVVPKVVVGTSSSLNNTTIIQTEQEAIKRDNASYQEFLNSIQNK